MLKRVVSLAAVLGLFFLAVLAYLSYRVILADNTNFEQNERVIYVESNATIAQVLEQLLPLLKNPNDFMTLAKRKGYYNRVRPGRFVLVSGMNNNDIINVLR